MSIPRILLMPLCNVLGHVSRTFSLAEKLFELKMDVHIASDGHYAELLQVLPDGITIHPTFEIPVDYITSFEPIRDYDIGDNHDLENLKMYKKVNAELSEIRSQFINRMIDEDKKLIEKLQPDIIITDYHFTASLLPRFPADRIFHISNILGFPSFYNRVSGFSFTPLDKGNVLVPGIQEIELVDGEKKIENRNIHWCGHFQWQGWKKMKQKTIVQPHADVLLYFGSTGNASKVIPRVIKNISTVYTISILSDQSCFLTEQENLVNSKFGNLAEGLKNSKVICCHGGHGTVMECILHKTPMLIFPNNLEQLEIGIRIEKLGLGLVINKPMEEMDPMYLNECINKLITCTITKKKLEHYSELLLQKDGPTLAAEIISCAINVD